MNPPVNRFIDANVIMYALGTPHPLRDPCKRVLEKIKTGEILAVTNTEVLQEILYRFSSIRRFDIGEAAYWATVRFCRDILPITRSDTDQALEILKKHPKIATRDAIHAATMINNDIGEILSTDTHFDLITGVTRIDPGSLA